MAKYKFNEDIQKNGSQVTLTSYMLDGDHTETDDVLNHNNILGQNLENSEIQRRLSHSNELDSSKSKCTKCGSKDSRTVLDLPEDQYLHHRPPPYTTKPTLKEWLKERGRKGCNKKVLYKRVPVLSWLPSYNVAFAVSDFMAGLTVGLTVIPQAIAYSNIAGLPPQIGLYSSFVSCFVYTILGSCKDVPVGPTAILALIVRENNHGMGIPGAVLLTFLGGCVMLVMGILQLGFLIDFISGPVTVGFTSAAAIMVATSQIQDLLGLIHPGGKFVQLVEKIFRNIGETNPCDASLGIGCIITLLVLRKVKDIKIGPENEKERKSIHNVLATVAWLFSTGRNIIVVVASASLAYVFEAHGQRPFRLTGFVQPGLPTVSPPPFSTQVGNTTMDFVDMTFALGSSILVMPVLAILENIALAKVFAEGKAVDATQELIALGACNVVSSFFCAMPVAGALSRGPLNNASGVKTTFGGVYTGLLVILSLKFFTPYFSYIPKASLAAVIISAVVFMVELHLLKPIWKTKKIDLIPAVITFFMCLFTRLEIGIGIGIAINLVFLLYSTARPSVHVEKITSSSGCEYLLITPDRSLTFPSVEYVRTIVSKVGIKQGCSSIPVVIDAKHIQGADFTTAKGIKELIKDFAQRRQPILFYNLKPSVMTVFQGVRPKDFIYCQSFSELNDTLKKYSIDGNGSNNTSITTISNNIRDLPNNN